MQKVQNCRTTSSRINSLGVISPSPNKRRNSLAIFALEVVARIEGE
ncbi:MAG: hypothetical protein V7K41_30380 [Nostoc sp.]